MFKKVKAKFMLISMIAISFVILLICGCTNVVNYIRMNQSNDEIIQYIMKNSFETAVPPNGPQNGEMEFSNNVPQNSAETTSDENGTTSYTSVDTPVDFGNHFGQESSYDIRYFTVAYKDGNYYFNLSCISSVSEEAAAIYADEAFEKGISSGYIESYRYALNTQKDFAVFLLCEKDLNAFHMFTFWSLLFSGIGLLIALAFIFVFSGVILKPVKESYDKQKQFITNASHELKTPLTVISTNNELLELKQGKNQYTETISKQIVKMNTMTKSLTSLARLSENPNISMEEVNLTELMDQIVDTFTPVFEKKGKTLKAEIADDVILKTNMEFFSQMVSIILDNACKYTLKTSEISLKADKGTVILSQRNDVENIKEGNLSYFTERFFRDDGMRTKVAGSGIGLSIAKEITQALHGKMKIYGKDSWFNIEIELK